MSDQSNGTGGKVRQWFSNPPKLPPVPKLSSLSSSLSEVFSPTGILSFSSPSNEQSPKPTPSEMPADSAVQNPPQNRSTPSPLADSTRNSAHNSVHNSPQGTPVASAPAPRVAPPGRIFGEANDSVSTPPSSGSPVSQQQKKNTSSYSSSSLLWPVSSSSSSSTRQEKGKEKNRESVVAKENPLDLLDDSKVTREHWQPETGYDKCANQECQKPLSGTLFQKKSHCRRCGHLYCDTCCTYQIRLDVNANHDPENGFWCRVCKQCFVARKGYAQEFGTSRNHTKLLKKLRGNRNEKQGLEASRLDMRLEKLQKIYADDSLSAAAKREKEKSIITWVDDSKILSCPTCSRTFSMLSNRKHHCRFCGEVVCAFEECSNMVILSRDTDRDQVRACTNCINMLTRNRKKEEQKQAAPNPILRYYEEVKKTQTKLEDLIPQFNEELSIFNSATDDRPKRASFENATSLRQTILQQFQFLEALAKKIAGLPTSDPNSSAQRVQNNILIAVNNYLQTYMFTLALLPSNWKSSSEGKKPADRSSVVAKPKAESQPQPKKPLSEEEKKKARETIEVLFEQKAQIDSFITKFKQEKQMEEVNMLMDSKKELEAEIKRLQSLT